ncbi:MAG: 3D domain-containing protein [Roseimicrobium sp.]
MPMLKMNTLVMAACFAGSLASCSSTTSHTAKAPVRRERLQDVRTTAYTHSESDHLAYGVKTADGGNLKYGTVRSAAADWSIYPVGTVFQIEGEPCLYQIDDYGSALVGTKTIDLYKPSRASMNQWGVRNVSINVLKWGSFDKSLHIMRARTKYPYIRQMVAKIERTGARTTVGKDV